MDNLRKDVKTLFSDGRIDLFIGYEQGTKAPRPIFAKNGDAADKLVFNDQCLGNLAVYLTRKDLVGNKKVGISASYYALRSISQLMAENQLKNNGLVVIALDNDAKLIELHSAEAINDFLKSVAPPAKPNDEELIAKLDAMTRQERWAFWSQELSKCFKCYACRAACPMCYCVRCVVEINRPQWIAPWATTQSNTDWQINRAMHMAGRCSDCGSCGTACPVNIPLHLLMHKMKDVVNVNFGDDTDGGNALSTFKPNDKEQFIR